MKALIDTNILLDVLIQRSAFFIPAAVVWKAAEEHKFDPVVSAISFTTIHYIIRRYSGQPAAVQAVSALRAGATHVITRDPAGFSTSKLIVISADDWIKLLA